MHGGLPRGTDGVESERKYVNNLKISESQGYLSEFQIWGIREGGCKKGKKGSGNQIIECVPHELVGLSK